jgi:DUF4097 and DUF4098 domain-containing protein YvlB
MSERTETFQVSERPRIELTIPSGSARIVSGEAGTVTVTLSGRDETIERFRVVQQGNAILIAPEEGRRRWSSVAIVVGVPEGADVDAKLASADLTADTTVGSIRARVASGDVRAAHVTGDVTVKTASGDVRLETVNGRITIAAASGDVIVETCGDDVQVNSASGDFVCGTARRGVQVKTASGDVVIRRFEGAAFNGTSLSGDVRIGIPTGRRLRIDCHTMSGSVRNKFEVKESEGGAGGGEEASLRVKTLSGDISFGPAD